VHQAMEPPPPGRNSLRRGVCAVNIANQFNEVEHSAFTEAGAFVSIIAAEIMATVFNLQSLGFRIVNFPAALSRTVVLRDVPYGAGEWQKLDVYAPPGEQNPKLPVVVFFYGGRWSLGSKKSYRFVGDAFAKRGCVAVIPDYSKYPQVRFPSFVQDGAKALAWVRDHISDHDGDPDRIFIAGHSAGAHIAALLAADRSYLAAEDKDRGDVVRGFAGLAGLYDFTPDEPDLEDMFGPQDRYSAMQVTTFIDGTQPPMLLLHGDADTAVKRYNLERVESRIKEKGGTVRSIVYRGVRHGWIVGALSWVNFRGPPVIDDMLAFFGMIK
jgi:acetyl esterase/lipase